MAEEKRKPSHRLIMQHDPDNDKSQTEVGALWPHKQGGGFTVSLRRGISISALQGVRINAFPLREDDRGRSGSGSGTGGGKGGDRAAL